MAGCDGRFVKSLSFVSILALFAVVSCLDSKRLGVFKSNSLKEKIKLSTHHPLCIVFTKADQHTKLEDIVKSIWTEDHNTGRDEFKKWEFGSFSFEKFTQPPVRKPKSYPTLRCYVGHSHPEYEGKHTKSSVAKWLENLGQKQFLYLEDASVETVEIAKKVYNTVIVAFPNTARHAEVEEMVYQESVKNPSLKTFIVHKNADNVRDFQNLFKFRRFPAVAVITKNIDNNSSSDATTVKVLSEGALTSQSLGVYLQARSMPIAHYNLGRFESEVMSARGSGYVPTLIVFYSHFGEHVQTYLTLLTNTVQKFKELSIRIKFGLMDLEDSDTLLILQNWVDPKFHIFFPMAVLYYQHDNGRIKHIKMEETRPSPLNVHQFLFETVGFVDEERFPVPYYLPWVYNPSEFSSVFEGPYGIKCTPWSHNTTDNDPVQPPAKKIKIRRKIQKKKEIKLWHEKFGTETVNKKLEKVESIPVLTSVYWSEVIEKSHAPQHPLQGGREWAGEVTKVALVVFVRGDCRSCQNSMPVFKNLQKSVSFVEGGSMYLVNCTSDNILCEQHDIRGFPTITAFRGLGWLHSSNCLREGSHKRYDSFVRLDFHGVILHDTIMDWFVWAATPAVTDNLFNWPDGKADDVSLFGVLVPRRSDFLPIPPQRRTDYYYSYECFRLACERLYGKVQCHSVYSKDIPSREFNTEGLDIVLSKVILKRKDGVSTLIMALGTSLAETIEDQSDTNLHKFHKPHRYNLPAHKKCEEDHAMCTELIIDYTLDHSRLPVTHLTTDLFHIHESESVEDSLPVLMALVHPDNITDNSQFFKELTGVAYELYNSLEVVTVNTIDYRGWAVHFVPVGYSMTVAMEGEDPLEMYVYPRICFVKRDNHKRAAFYPPLGSDRSDQSWYQKKNLLEFAKLFLSQPDKVMIDTDHF